MAILSIHRPITPPRQRMLDDMADWTARGYAAGPSSTCVPVRGFLGTIVRYSDAGRCAALSGSSDGIRRDGLNDQQLGVGTALPVHCHFRSARSCPSPEVHSQAAKSPRGR